MLKINKKLPGHNILLLLCLCPLSLTKAEIKTDGSLGLAQELEGPNYLIDEELGRRAGGNLFHSFKEFNVPVGGSATFTGSSDIANVISRVTGGNISNIEGLLKSEIGNANLYFINPAGVLFGPSASLSINGSFHVSTADFILLGEDNRFFSEPLQGEVLSTAAPRAFGFLGKPKGGITVDGSQLSLKAGSTLSLVGGEITINNKSGIYIPQGQINVVGVDSEGEVFRDTSAGHQDLDAGEFKQLNTVNIENRIELNVDGEGGGRVVIRGGQLILEETVISARTKGGQNGAGVEIVGDNIDFSSSRIHTTTEGTGDAGKIHMNSKILVLKNGVYEPEIGFFANSVNSNTVGDTVSAGKAGTIAIKADQVNVYGEIAFEANAVLPENTGIIDLSADELTSGKFDAEFQFNSGSGKIIRYGDNNIILDGTLHPDQEGNALTGPYYEVTEDMGETVGNNLFYSFRDFLVDECERVIFTFLNSESISNIIVRVTGDNLTGIYGDLTSGTSNINLYLINPNGLFFGPGVTFGSKIPFESFNFTTADYLILGDSGRFDASDPGSSELKTGDFKAYGFADNKIGEIVAENYRIYLNNGVISLIGGNIRLENTGLLAPYGHINLVSLQSTGEVRTIEGSNDFDVSNFN